MPLPLIIVDDLSRTKVAHNQIAGDMHAHAMLMSDAGVELRGNHTIHFRAASQEDADRIIAATKKRTDDIAHCTKLLVDLPVALSNSAQAMELAMDALDQNELGDIGAMALEQKRIKQEIASQQKRLVELESSPYPKLDPSTFRAREFCTRASMPFGTSDVNGTRYQLLRLVRSMTITPIPTITSYCAEITTAVRFRAPQRTNTAAAATPAAAAVAATSMALDA